MNSVCVQQSSAHPGGSCGSCPATPAWASSQLWCPPAGARGGCGDVVGVASVYGPTPDKTYTRVSAWTVIIMKTEGVHLTTNLQETLSNRDDRWRASCVLLTGLRGGRDLINSRMISCALFFNLGGMSPFTWKNTVNREKQLDLNISRRHHSCVCVLFDVFARHCNMLPPVEEKSSSSDKYPDTTTLLQRPVELFSPWLFAACSVWSGCHPSAFRTASAGTRWAAGCTDAPGPSSASRRLAGLASPAPRTGPGTNRKGKNCFIWTVGSSKHAQLSNVSINSWLQRWMSWCSKKKVFLPNLSFGARRGLWRVPVFHLPFSGGSGPKEYKIQTINC